MKLRLSGLLITLVCILLASCSKSGDTRLFEAIPADAEGVVFVGKQCIDAQKESVLADDDAWAKALYDGGLDEVAAMLSDDFKDVVNVYSLDNLDAVRSYLTETGASKVDTDDSTELYADGSDYVLIAEDGRFVYKATLSTPEEKVKFAALNATAKRTPFGRSAYCSALDAEGDMFGYYVIPTQARSALMASGVPSEMLTMLEGAVVFNGKMTGPELDARMWLVSVEGEKRTFGSYLPFSLDTSAKISKDALSYMGPNISIVGATALKDVNWEEFTNMLNSTKSLSFQQRAMLLMLRPYLEKIDGTVAVGLGVALSKGQNLTSLAFDPSALVATVAVETASGQSAALSSQIKELVKMSGMAASETKNGFSFAVPGMDLNVTVETRGKLMLLSTRPLVSAGNQSPALDVIPFGDYLSAVALSIPAESPLMDVVNLGKQRQDVALGVGLDAKKSEMTLKMVCGREGSFIENLRRMAKSANK